MFFLKLNCGLIIELNTRFSLQVLATPWRSSGLSVPIGAIISAAVMLFNINQAFTILI